MAKAKASTIAIIYNKMYGVSLPTPEKIENAATMADIVTWVYIIAQNDAVKNQWRLPGIESIVKEKYDTPGEVQDWLIDSVRKTYSQSFQERREKP